MKRSLATDDSRVKRGDLRSSPSLGQETGDKENDCVIIPGESGYAPSAKIDEFLFANISENKTGA